MKYTLLIILIVLSGCNEQSDPPHYNMTGGLVGVWYPAGSSRGNIILHQGHNTFDGKNDPRGSLVPIAEIFADAGYTVYGVEMPPMPHEGRTLDDFLAPVYALLDDIGPSYMVGLSGGGWTTTVITAHDNRIIKGFSVAGDAPLDVWSMPDGSPGRDWEQLQFDYRMLYDMAGGRLVHIYNANDSCCFWGITGDVGYPYITDHTSNGVHTITPWAAETILEMINTP